MIKKIISTLLAVALSFNAFAACNPILPLVGGSGACNNNSYTTTLGGAISTQGALSFIGAHPLIFNLLGSTTLTLPAVVGTLISSADVGTVTNTMLAGSIADSKLNTISTAGKVSNSATTATNANAASAIVARDASGNFSAGTITAALNGNASTATNGVVTTGSYSNPSWITALANSKITGLTLANTFTTSGNFPLTLTTTGSTNVTLPTSGTLATTGGTISSITGSSNQVLVNGTTGSPVTGAVTLTLPQFIGTSSTPQFGALTLSSSGSGLNLTNNTITSGTIAPLNWLGQDSSSGAVFYGRLKNEIMSNTAGATTSKTTLSVQNGSGSLTDYMDLDGSTERIHFFKALSLSSPLTPANIYYSLNNLTTNGSGKLDTIQDINNLASPQFVDVNLSGLSASSVVTTDSSKNLSSVSILTGGNGGTNNGFMQFSGPATSLKTYTLPNASTTILTTNAAVTAGQGGTGLDSSAWALGDVPYISTTGVWNHLTGNTTTTRKFLRQTGNGSVSAAPAWDTITAADITGAALTKTDDTNVTLTLGGSPTTALLNAASLTLGWTGQLGLTRGGSNASLTASNGGLVYSTASAMAILSGTATAGQIPRSGANAAPSWSTATFASTYSASNLLYSNGANTVTGLATANNGALVTDSSGVPSISATLPSAVQDNITRLGTIGTVYNNSVQPRFFARYTSNVTNVTGNGVEYTLIFDTANTNVGTMYDTSTGTVTIPSSGFYKFGAVIYLNGLGASNTNVICKMYTTGLNVINETKSAATKDSNNNLTCHYDMARQFSSGNTISLTVEVDGGTQIIGVKGTSPQISYFYGYLLD